MLYIIFLLVVIVVIICLVRVGKGGRPGTGPPEAAPPCESTSAGSGPVGPSSPGPSTISDPHVSAQHHDHNPVDRGFARTADPQTHPGGKPPGWVCALDFGTSYTKAAVRRLDDEVVHVVRFGNLRSFPSAISLDPTHGWLVGDQARAYADADPSRAEIHPKRRVGDPSIYLGDAGDMRRYSVVFIVAKILDEAYKQALKFFPGVPPAEIRLTYPVAWGEPSRGVLTTAMRQVGVSSEIRLRLVSEAEAAAEWFLRRGDSQDRGSRFGVYDFGGGTVDTAVVQTNAGQPHIACSAGKATIGGHDLDVELFEYAGQQWKRGHPRDWEMLLSSPDREWRACKELAIRQSMEAKQVLSRRPKTSVHFKTPAGNGPDNGGWDIPVFREQFESKAKQTVDASLDELRVACRRAGVVPEATSALPVYLSGGSSRIPLVQREVYECYTRPGDFERMSGDPELVVVQGAAMIKAVSVDFHAGS